MFIDVINRVWKGYAGGVSWPWLYAVLWPLWVGVWYLAVVVRGLVHGLVLVGLGLGFGLVSLI